MKGNNPVIKGRQKWGADVFDLLSWFEFPVVEQARIMVVGAGALGNEVLKDLALFGIGHIVVVDMDTIEYSNLCRSVLFRPDDVGRKRYKAQVAAERVRDINPEVRTMAVCGDVGADVGLGVFRRMDLAIGCLDSRYARYVLNRHCFRAGIPWIDGGIENLVGYARVFKNGRSCYECAMTDTEKQYLMVKTGCPDIAKVNVSYGRIATTPVSASVIGAIQVQEALKLLHPQLIQGKTDGSAPFFDADDPLLKYSEYKNLLLGKELHFDGQHLVTNVFKTHYYHEDCVSHETWKPVTRLPELSAHTPVNHALEMIRKHFKTDDVEINMMNNRFITRITPEDTGIKHEVLLPESKLADFIENRMDSYDPTKKIIQEYYENIDRNFPYPEMTLNQVGFPMLDIIQVTTPLGLKYVEFGKDEGFLDCR